MRRSQGYRHIKRPVLPAIAREHHSGYTADHGERPTPSMTSRRNGDVPRGDLTRNATTGTDGGSTPAPDVTGAVATILADHEGAPLPAGELAELVATLRAADRLTARAVRLAGQLDARRAAAEEGMTCDGALRLHTGLVGSDVARVLTAAQVLGSMPAVAGLFARGVLSWGHVRQLTSGVHRFDAATRTALDAYLGQHADRFERLDPERRTWAIEDAIDDHRRERTSERRAERQEQAEFLALQAQLDGSGSLYGQFGPEAFATIVGRLEAEADTPRATPCPGDQDGPSGPVPTRSQQLADALFRLCTTSGGGDGRVGAPVRFSVTVDAGRVTDRAAGHIAAGVRGRPPRIVRRAIERLACDAALDVVIRDGVDLLAAHRYAPEVTAATRRAVAGRDGGCRFPGCTAPVSWCDVHHVRPRAAEQHPDAADGDHHPTNLVSMCRRHHTIVHRRGWHQHLDPDGTYRLRRRGRAWTTLPRHDRQLPEPNRPGTEVVRAGPEVARAGPDTPRAEPQTEARAGPQTATRAAPSLPF